MKTSGDKLLSNFIWRFLERCGAQLVTFFVTLVLARLLSPDEFGLVALIVSLTNIIQLIVDSGLGLALVQKIDANNKDFSTVFYANVILCTGMYILLFIAAPMIARFYNIKTMTILIRVLGLNIVVAGLKNVQQAYVSRYMLFRRFFLATLGGTICAAIIGIGMAYLGYGVWALIVQNLVNVIIDTIILWITVKWKPEKYFSLKRFKQMFSYGWKLMAASVLDAGYSNIQALLIGHIYSTTDLGIYNQGEKIPKFVIGNINASIDSVLLPAMSSVQGERERVKKMTRRSITVSTYVMAPMLMWLFVVAPSFIKFILTDKWLPSVPYLRIFCIIYLFYPIHTANLDAIRAVGRSDMILKLEIIKICIGMMLLIPAMYHGMHAIAYSLLINSFIAQIINAWPNKKLLQYTYIEQMKDILPCVFSSIIMGICIYPIGYIKIPVFFMIFIQLMVGVVIYMGLSFFLKIDIYKYIFGAIKSLIENK